MYYKHLYYVFRFLCKVDYESDMFIHAPTYTYNEVMWLLELAIFIIKCEYYCKYFIKPHKWHVLIWIVVIKISNGPNVFLMTHDNTPPLFLLHFKCFQFTIKNMPICSTKFSLWTLNPCTFTKFGFIAYVLPLTSHVLPQSNNRNGSV